MDTTQAQPDPKAAEIRRLQQRQAAANGRIRELQAKYDAAQTTTDNVRLWVNADALAAQSANRPEVRRTLRNRCRYEVANNSHAKGIVWTIAGDTVGTGPTLQLSTKSDDLNSSVESEFALWAKEIKLAEKLRIMRAARPSDGEIFAVFVSNPGLKCPVKLDIQLFEAEQFADPHLMSALDPQWDDGIHYDGYGNPLTFRKLRQHPGYLGVFGANPFAYDDISADYVWHYQKLERAGQRRGIPELTPAVQLFNDLRRYRGAVLAASETAARLSVLIHTKAPADVGSAEGQAADVPSGMDTFDLPKSGGLTLPDGYDATQMKAEQPTTTYDTFTRTILAEIARCLNVPYTIAALDSSVANTSARYMDAEFYVRDRKIDRHDFECFLDRVLDLWLTEATYIPEYLPEDAEAYPHEWYWPALAKHADPDKVATAQAQRLKNGTSSIARELADDGKNWEKELKLAARSYGITVEQYQKLIRYATFDTVDGETAQAGGTQEPSQADELKTLVDTMGIAVRGGLVTPSADDENYVRKLTGLPPANEAVREAWKENGTREPVTMQPENTPETPENVAKPGEKEAPGDAKNDPETGQNEPSEAEKAGIFARLVGWLKAGWTPSK